jgi:nitrite reductase (NADH) small subunit
MLDDAQNITIDRPTNCILEDLMPDESTRWTRVGSFSECPTDSPVEFVVEGRIIAIFRVDDQVYALDGICPHQGGPLGQGKLEGCIVTCPWHGWQYDVHDGQHTSIATLKHTSFPTKVENGDVLIALPNE